MKEEGLVALHLPIGPLKICSGLKPCCSGDVNPVPTSPLADGLATAPSGPVFNIVIFVQFIEN